MIIIIISRREKIKERERELRAVLFLDITYSLHTTKYRLCLVEEKNVGEKKIGGAYEKILSPK